VDAVNESSKISIFSVKKKEKPHETTEEKTPSFIIENIAFGNENILNQLGITTTSVYLSNCSLWVEGITDRLYIQKFIGAYLSGIEVNSKYRECTEFKEGVHYSFVLSGGDSIIHWDFADEAEYEEHTQQIVARKFCAKSLVIVDNDFDKNPVRKEALRKALGERFLEHLSPEIENLLSPEIINQVLITYPSVAKSLPDVKLVIPDPEIYKTKKIGYIIDKLILKDFVKAKSFAAANESLKSGDKFEFCNKALSFIKTDTLTEEAKHLVEKVLDFIVSKNQV
jgi:hypothetical protein